MKIHTCNFSDYFCIYSKEIYDIFSIYPLNTGSKEADYIITCLSNELNYPKYGNMNYARGQKAIGNTLSFMQQIFGEEIYIPFSNKKYIIFFHTSTFFFDNIINICYSKDEDDINSIVICPPAIKKYEFSKILLQKKYLVSFKGNVNASIQRLRIFQKISKYNNYKDIIIIDRNTTDYDYDDLMINSVFGIIIEGDLPWSYRLTECINAGTIPIIIKPKNKNIFAFDELIDYTLFSLVIVIDEIDNFIQNTLLNISVEKIENMRKNLEIVNNKYFKTRETQMNGVLEILENRVKITK